jgi:hypothetical protein
MAYRLRPRLPAWAEAIASKKVEIRAVLSLG